MIFNFVGEWWVVIPFGPESVFTQAYMLQVKSRLIIFMNKGYLEDKEIENQPTGRLKNFNLNIILTFNIYI